jgi:hypothetical protein
MTRREEFTIRGKPVHVPHTHRDDGSRIGGLLRCKNCLLSETYWKRWPECQA